MSSSNSIQETASTSSFDADDIGDRRDFVVSIDDESPPPAKSSSCLGRFAHRYARFRDYVVVKGFSHPYLTAPLFRSWSDWLVHINIVELIVFAGLFAGLTLAGSGSDYGDACIYMSALILLPVSRNSIFTVLTGVPFERLIKYHRWISYYTLVPYILHGVLEGGWVDDWTDLTGTITLACLGFLVLTSLEFIRRRFYEVFYVLHFSFIGLVIFAVLHTGKAAAAFAPGLVLWGIDILLRLLNMRKTVQARITLLPEDMVLVEVPKNDETRTVLSKYKPGQHCYLNVPSISALQSHPFSMSSAPHEKSATFHIKNLGNWTNKLQQRTDRKELITTRIDGPYGRTTVPYKRYRGLVLVGGGTGFTPMLSILKDFHYRKCHKLRANAEHIEVFWVCRSTNALNGWFRQDLQTLIDQTDVPMEIHCYVTRAEEDYSPQDVQSLPYIRGRPDFRSIFEELHTTFSQKGIAKVALLTCGSELFVNNVKLAALARSSRTTSFHF
mmetsp:Transcript_19262/g.28690  ORF Transcript_19262/g.28690 Transcript_19262/m.28690 type:complete len:498 (-) Transcript_19262:62-1555(-)|eukprot:CAMPEP_0201551910 /NCGR_PEP_ID=MMETSP0173_2-20130828/12133_1 /ASSEMBLY_ACC=CAM_ASM_000268 /TAXON_ID=218659 /ORGANISM="Vexillifera sp., Strain DIVA3 564/2" /LENGTH=497 /DNA_ID=CAMNT_0047962275 /DNA_START=56 /DNA_END=1549 /DNA_ORIENTATION=-